MKHTHTHTHTYTHTLLPAHSPAQLRHPALFFLHPLHYFQLADIIPKPGNATTTRTHTFYLPIAQLSRFTLLYSFCNCSTTSSLLTFSLNQEMLR